MQGIVLNEASKDLARIQRYCKCCGPACLFNGQGLMRHKPVKTRTATKCPKNKATGDEAARLKPSGYHYSFVVGSTTRVRVATRTRTHTPRAPRTRVVEGLQKRPHLRLARWLFSLSPVCDTSTAVNGCVTHPMSETSPLSHVTCKYSGYKYSPLREPPPSQGRGLPSKPYPTSTSPPPARTTWTGASVRARPNAPRRKAEGDGTEFATPTFSPCIRRAWGANDKLRNS